MNNTILLRARPVSRTINGTRHVPAYDIFLNTSTFASYSLYSDRKGWGCVAVEGRYGVSCYDEDVAANINQSLRPNMMFSEALAVVRREIEADYRRASDEAQAEMETERRAEAFWENRMSDEDRAREDWEYSMYGA